MRTAASCLLSSPLIALFACGLPSSALASGPGSVDLVAERRAIEDFQAFDQKLQDVGWRLVRGNADFCARTVPSIGLQLQDLRSYGGPEIARAALAMEGDFAIQTIARASPASREARLTANKEVIALNGVAVNEWPAEERYHWQRLTRTHDFIDAALAEHGALTVTLVDQGDVMLEPVPICATRFELSGEGKRALADGSRVIFGIRFAGFGYGEELFAAAVAHELAHNLLAHRIWLDANGRKRKHVRLTEREADRLMPWLLANAGYDPRAAHRFMTKWGPSHDRGLFRARTHDGWDERAEFILGEIPEVERLMTETGSADWSVHFRREIDPDLPSRN